MALDITTRRDFIDAVRRLLHDALAAGVPDIRCSDIDFAEWPLDEPPLLEALTHWARPHRRLLLLAQHYDEVQRRHPRFVHWRRVWDHVVQARSPTELAPADHPCLLLAGGCTLELMDRVHWRGRCSDAPADAQRCRELLDAITQRSQPAFAATTLGL